MAGLGLRLSKLGYKEPKPLVQILGKPIVEWAIETIGKRENFIFCCNKKHIIEYDLENFLREKIPNCKIVSIDHQTEGTAKTILEAKNLIDNDEELFISDSDHYIQWNKIQFNEEIRTKPIDACVFIFPENQNSKDYSYVKINDDGFVIESAEKIPISKIACAGMHYFRKGSDFVKYAEIMIESNHRFNNEFYVTPVYNELSQAGKKTITFPILKKWALGSKDEIDHFLSSPPNLD
jgi:NDP-sugar pyrophosphorylase family protein